MFEMASNYNFVSSYAQYKIRWNGNDAQKVYDGR